MNVNIGCDIVENKRLKNKKEDFINYILTTKEQKEYKEKGLQYLTGRFAAKEAIMKCLKNTKELNYLDIEILNNKDGEPITNIKNIKLSISHEKNYTIAVALKIK